MNKLNVFNTYWCSWKYLSNWPTNFRVFFRQFKWAYQRVTKGYCDFDWWDMDTYLSQLIPDMLERFIKDGHGYPGTDEFPTTEKWNEYLQKTIDLFRYSQSELPNEYEEAWIKKWEEKDFDIINKEETPEEKEITDKYLAIENNNDKKKMVALDEALQRVFHIFHDLWD